MRSDSSGKAGAMLGDVLRMANVSNSDLGLRTLNNFGARSVALSEFRPFKTVTCFADGIVGARETARGALTRQNHLENRAFSVGSAQHRSVMRLCHITDNGKPKTTAPGLVFIQPQEPVKNPCLHRWRNTGAIVGKAKQDRHGGKDDGDIQPPAGIEGIFRRVVEQVGDHLLDQYRVAGNRAGCAADLKSHIDIAPELRLGKGAHPVTDKAYQINRLDKFLEAAAPDPFK